MPEQERYPRIAELPPMSPEAVDFANQVTMVDGVPVLNWDIIRDREVRILEGLNPIIPNQDSLPGIVSSGWIDIHPDIEEINKLAILECEHFALRQAVKLRYLEQ